MFEYIHVKVLLIDGISITILVENTGLGLEVLASPTLIAHASQTEAVSLWIHHHITEVSEALFGFATPEERTLFRSLIKVSGIGGKTALNMLALGEDALLTAIQTEDDKLLSSVPGIGKKTAQKIIVDLKGSIDFSKKSSTSSQKNLGDISIISSLVTYGFDKAKAEEILANIDTNLSIEERTKMAILQLSKK